MFTRQKRKIAAILCFFIFLSKMLIAATPVFSSSMDKDTFLQIVLQLELECSAKHGSTLEDHQDSSVKYFNNNLEYCLFICPEKTISPKVMDFRNEKDICSFHPAVPTPPPNC